MAAIRDSKGRFLPKGSTPTVVDRDLGWKKTMAKAGVKSTSGDKTGEVGGVKLVKELGGLAQASIKGVGIFGQRRVVKVGIQGSEATEVVEGDEGEDITTVVLAAVHEFGRLDGTIPSRSFIRATVDAKRTEYIALIKRLAKLVLFDKLTDRKALALLGERVASDIKAAFEQGLEPKLAPSTVLRKVDEGKAPPYKPVLDTGHLKNSITYKVA